MFNYLTIKLGLPYEKNSYITLNKRDVFKHILANGAWKDGTKEAYMFMAGRFLFNINNNDKYSKIFSQERFDFMIEGRENTGNNELDEKEK